MTAEGPYSLNARRRTVCIEMNNQSAEHPWPSPSPLLSAFGLARSTVTGTPLSANELVAIHGFWRACNYLAAGMIYLRDNPLLRRPLLPSDIKQRLLGHWGSSPGLSFVYTHCSRLIAQADLEMLLVVGPGHGAPGVLAPSYLEGTYSSVYPEITEDEAGLGRFFGQFSFPGGIGSHCTPETPGSLHEGGELGYSLSHAYGAAFDNPNLIVACVVGDGEAETGPLATAWHSNKFLNPKVDGAVLPILHLNGYKINNPTVLARISHDELESLMRGYGYQPFFVEGSDPATMHQAMAATLDRCVAEIKAIQDRARGSDPVERPAWPMIVLRTPKGWTGPVVVDGHQVEGSWRAHQVPLTNVMQNPDHLTQLQEWLRSYDPDELFDRSGRLRAEYLTFLPEQKRRLSASPHANGGVLRRPLRTPEIDDYAALVDAPGTTLAENTRPLGQWLRDIVAQNLDRFRVFSPDENTSNKLDDIYAATGKTWMAEQFPSDTDGGNLATDGRVMEMLSEHTLEGWLEGYLLSGRHGFLSSYEAFVHVIDSMVNQHCKWLESARNVTWRAPVSSLNLLITSTVWRQDHNGFTHQDPGFIDVVANKSPDITRIYLPPDVNSLLVIAEDCLASTDLVNVIVADKQSHLQFLSLEDARMHCVKRAGIWDWASTDDGREPDVVLACAGDVPTMEALAASALLREAFPDIALRFVNVVDLLALQPPHAYPHGLTDAEFDSLFTKDRPVIFNFHGYPWLIHRLTYRRTNHDNLHVRGYKERGNINTPLDLAIENNIDRFSIAIDAIDRVERLQKIGSHARNHLVNERLRHQAYAHEHGVDVPETAAWTWPL